MSSAPDPRRRVAAAALLEILAWLVPAAAFLWIYTGRLGATSAAVLPHLRVVFALAVVTVLIRWMVHAWCGRKAAAAGGALVTGTVLCALWLYYATAVVGFDAWGYLVSWALISTYVYQAAYMVDVFGPGVYVIAALVLGVFLAVVAGIHALYRRGDWLPWASGHLHLLVTATVALAASVLLAAFLWRYIDFPPTREGEPLALSLWPDSLTRKFQTNLMRQGGQLVEKERVARSAYAHVQPRLGSNVILIVSDALRARNMQVYGYERPTTPFLSEVVASGSAVRLRRAQSVCSESACGLMGIGSSRYIHQFVDNPLTLPEVLRLHGYEAHMVLSGDHTNFYGLRTMYGQVDSYFDGTMSPRGYANDDALAVDALRRLKTRSPQGNFIQVHLMASHLLGRRTPPARFGEEQTYLQLVGGKIPSEQERRRFTNFYDSGVLRADQTIRELLDVLRSKGLMDDALVVVTADHGEFIGERGLYAHNKSVFGEVLDIPLLLIASGKAGSLQIDENRLASQVDIAPTVLSQLGLPIPPTWSGIPLQSRVATGERQVHFQQNAEFGLVERKQDGRTWKYWLDAWSGQEFAFDLDNDPLETTNRAAEIDPADRKRWRMALMLLEVSAREFVGSR